MNALEFQFHILPIYPLSTWAITVQPSLEFPYSNSMVDRLIRAVVLIDSHCNSKEISIASGHLRLHVELPSFLAWIFFVCGYQVKIISIHF